MREYAFDIKMYAVVRIKAESRKKAESALETALDCADLDIEFLEKDGNVLLTEASVYVDDVELPFLFEVDSIPVENDECEADDTNDSSL